MLLPVRLVRDPRVVAEATDDLHLIRGEGCLHSERTAGPPFARQAMTHGDDERIALHLQPKLPTVTGGLAGNHRRETYRTPARATTLHSARAGETAGKTGREVSEIGFGAWAIGGSWGETDDEHVAGGDGRRRRRGRHVLRHRRRLRRRPLRAADRDAAQRARRAALRGHEVRRGARRSTVENYTYENLRAWLERSRENLGVETVDLVQLHCPPWETYYTPAVFEACDRLVDEGLSRAYGVSVEKVEEGLKAIEYPGVATVQIIFNIFRQRPAELFFEQARQRDVGVIVRVPLASGLLTGKFDRDSRFAADDHRAFNRRGEAFDVGETFAGVDFETRPRGGRGAAGARAGRARRWRSSRCAGSSASRRSRRSFRAPRRPSRRVRTPPLPSCRRCPRRRCARSPAIYRERIAPSGPPALVARA